MSGIELIAALGAIQGTLLLALIILRFRRVQNAPLAILLVAFSLRLGTIPLWNPVSMMRYPVLLPLTTPLPYLFGPLLWWFAHELSNDTGLRTSPRILGHFIPYFFDLVFTALLVVVNGEAYQAMIQQVFAGDPPLHFLIRNLGKVVVNVTYVALAIRLAFRRAPVADVTPHQRLWLRTLVIAPIASLALFGFVALSARASAQLAGGLTRPFTMLAGSMALLIYVFSFLFVTAPEVPSGHTAVRRYSGSEDDESLTAVSRTVCEYLAGGSFRDPDLTLDTTARAVGVHTNRVSHAVNSVFQTSFPAYVNSYRIEYFIDRAAAGELEDRTILDLALDAGFSSKSTFNRVFKASVGVSPTQFRRSVLAARASSPRDDGTVGPGC